MPDAALLPTNPWNSRLADNGPLYVETDFSRTIVEPCNAITASLFVLLVVFWVWRLRGQYRQHLFLCTCLPVLLIGGVGGTIYHALRSHKLYFYLDVVPIGLLVIMGSIYLWIRLKPKLWHVLLLLASLSISPMLFAFISESHVAIVVHYVMLAALILVPVGIVLIKTQFRHAQLIYLTMATFGLAILFRFLDPLSAPILPGVGTHWLWHTGGAITTAILAEYFYRIEGEPIGPLPVTSSGNGP